MSTILIRGPFTEAELTRLVSVLQDIEATRPEEIFEIHIDDMAVETEVEEFLAKVNPLRAGYERMVRYRSRK